MKHLTVVLMLLTGMLLAAPVFAQEKSIPMDRQQIHLSFAPLVKQVSPAVVNIFTKRTVQQRVGLNPLFNDPFFEQFFGRSFGGNLGTRERTATSLGSGVLIDSAGLIITNAHVIDRADEINVVLKDGREFSAEQIFSDPRIDLSVLKIDAEGKALPTLNIPETTDLEVGDLVLAIGNPFGVGQSVTSGIVSALARTTVGISDYNFFIQTDAAINPGNSGGALVAMNGDLVGINSAIYTRDGGSMGIGFAIPIEMVRTVLNSVKRGERELVQPWLGITGQTVTSDIARSLNLPAARGSMITGIHPKSAPGRAGIKTGDIVYKLNGKPVSDPAAMKFYLAMVEIGDDVVLDVYRKGEPLEITFVAELPPEDPPRNETIITGSNPFSNVTVSNINPAVMEEYDLGAAEQGVIVIKPVARDLMGLRIGDIIHKINKQKIKSVKHLQDVLTDRPKKWQIEIMRGGRILSVVLR